MCIRDRPKSVRDPASPSCRRTTGGNGSLPLGDLIQMRKELVRLRSAGQIFFPGYWFHKRTNVGNNRKGARVEKRVYRGQARVQSESHTDALRDDGKQTSLRDRQTGCVANGGVSGVACRIGRNDHVVPIIPPGKKD